MELSASYKHYGKWFLPLIVVCHINLFPLCSSQILGPSLYGLVYMKTVATFPRAIFAITVASVVLSFFLFSLVRLPKDKPSSRVTYTDVDADEMGAAHYQEQTLVDDQ